MMDEFGKVMKSFGFRIVSKVQDGYRIEWTFDQGPTNEIDVIGRESKKLFGNKSGKVYFVEGKSYGGKWIDEPAIIVEISPLISSLARFGGK